MSDRTFFSRAIVLALLGPLAGCSGADAGGAVSPTPAAEHRDVTIHHEACDTAASGANNVDVNGDGRPDIVHVTAEGREVCRVVDLNFDGSIDAFVYFGPDGAERRRESDYDRDGRADEIVLLRAGVVIRKERETNYDDKLDTWDYYEGGRLVRRERDSDGDAIVDQWWQFNDPNNPKCAIVARDDDGNGKADPASVVDLCAPDEDKAAAPPAAPSKVPTTPVEGPSAGPPKTNKETP